jgi:alpha-glucosidase
LRLQILPGRRADSAVVTCVINLSGEPAAMAGLREPLVSSAPLAVRAGDVVVPVDAAAWFGGSPAG